ncbi:hypothetical protein BSP239C_03250 [Brevibacterium sp. 239c]|nr:hypothetical protein BSP239C_03250 [Brevibacterium sp. 239c]
MPPSMRQGVSFHSSSRGHYSRVVDTQTKAVKDLEKENARLKKLVAEKELAIDILNEVARGKF